MFRLVNVSGRAALERDGGWYDLAGLSGDATLADPLVAVARHRELHTLHEQCVSAVATGPRYDAWSPGSGSGGGVLGARCEWCRLMTVTG